MKAIITLKRADNSIIGEPTVRDIVATGPAGVQA